MAEKNKKNFLASSLSAEEMKAPKVDSAHVEDFKTPDEIAATDADETGAVIRHHDDSDLTTTRQISPKDGPSIKDKLLGFYDGHKKACIIVGVLLIVILAGAGYILLKPDKKATIPPIKAVKKSAAKVTTVPSTLTGLPVDPSTNKRPVTAIMVENSTDARPQSGLSQAGVVFEAIAEGGITRFLTLYQDTAPTNIGPIRSARPYYVEWELGFDAAYAHVGGSPEALSDIKAWGVKDLDQFYNGGSYQRITSRAAPHNVYTSIAALNQLEASKGYTTSTFTGFARNTKDTPAKVPTAKTINLSISGPDYNVHYDYVAATNSYNRSEGGAPHMDANTNTQLSPKVVIALITTYGIQSDGKHSDYGVLGSGQAMIFQNGTETAATWTKATDKSQITFTNASGAPVKLNAGQTWITAVDGTSDATYAP